MDYAEVTIHTTTLGAEVACALLDRVGVGGAIIEDRADIDLYQRDEGDWDYIDEHIADQMSEDVLVKGYMEEDARLHDRLTMLRGYLADALTMDMGGLELGTLQMDVRHVREEDWANNWKKYYVPFPVGERLWVKPMWIEEACPPGRAEVTMDPGMAFGTGSHETTFMCMELLQEYVRPGMRVYDIGCGTGILAIAALRLGASWALAVDRDPVCVSAACNNRELNGIDASQIPVELGNLLDGIGPKCDLMVSNIIADVIILMAESAWAHLDAGAVWIVSGIIRERRGDVEAALDAAGFEQVNARSKGEWVALAYRKR